MFSLFWPKKVHFQAKIGDFQAKIGDFLTLKLINFLVQTL